MLRDLVRKDGEVIIRVKMLWLTERVFLHLQAWEPKLLAKTEAQHQALTQNKQFIHV